MPIDEVKESYIQAVLNRGIGFKAVTTFLTKKNYSKSFDKILQICQDNKITPEDYFEFLWDKVEPIFKKNIPFGKIIPPPMFAGKVALSMIFKYVNTYQSESTQKETITSIIEDTIYKIKNLSNSNIKETIKEYEKIIPDVFYIWLYNEKKYNLQELPLKVRLQVLKGKIIIKNTESMEQFINELA